MQIFNQDCVVGAKQHIKTESVDLLICDPPFGIGEASFDKHYNRDKSNVVSGYVEAPDNYEEWCVEWLTQAHRVLKPNGSFYLVSGYTRLGEILNAMKATGFHVVNHIIWKYNFGVYTKNKFVSAHYHILYATKSQNAKPHFNTFCRFGPQEKKKNKSLLYQDLEDVWTINKEYAPGQKKNANKLPEALVEKMVLYSSRVGDVVCDFFLGNFTTANVAKRLGRVPMGFEMNPEGFTDRVDHLGTIVEKIPKPPVVKRPKNQGKPITEEERQEMHRLYQRAMADEMTKKDAIGLLMDEFERGKFSILNVLAVLE